MGVGQVPPRKVETQSLERLVVGGGAARNKGQVGEKKSGKLVWVKGFPNPFSEGRF